MNWSNNLSKKLRNSYNAMKRLLRGINTLLKKIRNTFFKTCNFLNNSSRQIKFVWYALRAYIYLKKKSKTILQLLVTSKLHLKM
jgi:hypothetical protein